jgi:HD-GYP domain-containing protein (c-di-GMP phosphodiesterase class II)
MENWTFELDRIQNFIKRLDESPPVPTLSEDDLNSYSREIIYLQDLFSLIASLPVSKRPDIEAWDEVVSKLWRKFFAKGDDIDRYTLGDIWLKILLDTDHSRRILRTTTAFVASARNFSLFDEALEVGTRVAGRYSQSPCGALANLLNSVGSVHYCKKDYEKADECFQKAFGMADAFSEEESSHWIGVSRTDFRGQEIINRIETYLDRGSLTEGDARADWALKAEKLISEIDSMPISKNLASFLLVTKTEFSMIAGNFKEAGHILDRIEELSKSASGPYYYSLLTTHARLSARLCGAMGDWNKAYQWIRKALRFVSTKNYPAEDIFVLEDAIKIVRKLHNEKKGPEDSDIVKDLVFLLEDKDWYTGGSHSRQVAELSLRIGHILKKSGAGDLDILELEMAGLVHDIGKLKIPWSLLNKVAPITPKEREILKLHAQFGKEILEEIGLDASAAIVYEHHETMDSKGYPRGKLPSLPAAIVGISDVFDASTTLNRRYKVAKGIPETMDEIRSLSNLKYHPDVVRGLGVLMERLV